MTEKESYFYVVTEKGVQCTLCPHKCNLAEGQYGLCRSRVNKGGKLITEAYGRVCALNIDPIEKKPLFHFYPGTKCISMASTGCNFACDNCQNANISQVKVSDVPTTQALPEDLINACLQTGSPTIAYTYTEPLTYFEYVYDTAKLAHEKGVMNVLVSAGYVNEEPLRKLAKYLDAANIDLKAFDEDFYIKVNHGRLKPVLSTLKILKEEGVWIEITNLLIPTLNDDEAMIKNMCDWLVENGFQDFPLHFSRFFPTYKMTDIPATSTKTLIKAVEIAKEAGMKFVYAGNAPEIRGENTYCPHCNILLIDRDGFVVLNNYLENGCCPNCGTHIPGRW